MANRNDLPFLISLLDDESSIVRTEVTKALKSFGPDLDNELAPYLEYLPPAQVVFLTDLSHELRMSEFNDTWLSWLDMHDASTALEEALMRLSFLNFGSEAHELSQELGELANRFLESDRKQDAESLIRFLFEDEGFGIPGNAYAHPLHSDLMYVLQTREGDQLSLSCLAILVGHRVGIDLHGIQIPGHFMLAWKNGPGTELFNILNKGNSLSDDSLQHIQNTFKRFGTEPKEMRVHVYEIVLQVLQNTIESYCRRPSPEQAQVYANLYEALMQQLKNREIAC